MTWSFGAESNLTNPFRVAVSLTQIPDLAFHGVQEDVGASGGTAVMSYSLLIEYVPSPVVYLFMSKLEFAAGAGVVCNSVSSWNSLYAYDYASGPPEAVFNEIEKKTFGFHLRAGLDYYFHRNLSCQFKMDGKLFRSIDMPAISYARPIVDEIYRLPGHPINFSSIDLSICLRFHF